MLNDTLLGFKTLAASATDRILVVWINEYFGPVSRDGKTFNQMQVYLDIQDKVVASVAVPERNRDTFGESIRMMRERKLGGLFGRLRPHGVLPSRTGPQRAVRAIATDAVRVRCM